MARIMVVEDEPITAADLEQKLVALGHDVTAWVDTGEDALLQAKATIPDLVLMDIRLRGAMNGIETARQLSREGNPPVVFLTAFADSDTVNEACHTEPYGYLVKPFTEQAVATAVQVALTRARVERVHVERERWASAALTGTGEGLVAVDQHGIVRYLNEHAELFLKVKAVDAQGRRGDAVIRFGAAHEAPEPFAAALVHGQVTSSPSRALTQYDGGELDVAYSAAPVFMKGGANSGAIFVFHARLEQAAADSSSLEALSTLSRRLSHEINNPLTYNLGAVHLALKELDQLRALGAIASLRSESDRARHAEQLARIEGLLRDAYEGATRVAGVVRELGAFAMTSRDVGPIEPASLVDLATGLGRSPLPEQVRIGHQLAPAPMIHGNKWQLARVLAFALDSALDSLGARAAGSVLVSLRSDAKGWALFQISARKEPRPLITLVRPHEPSDASSSPRSTSVGMTLAEQIVQAHGGEFMLSERPEGRMLEVRLPPIDLGCNDAWSPSKAGVRGSVLVIDDEPMIGRVLAISLEPEHDVTAVTSAESALALLEQGDAFDVILCDLAMPGIGGQEFFARLQTLRPDLTRRVVFMSGGATTESGQLFLQAHRDSYIAKPFQTDQLLRLIDERVRQRQLPASRAQC